jgi:hypothetical protein
MIDHDKVQFRNRSWKVIRVFFFLGLIFLAIGLLPMAVVWCWPGGQGPSSAAARSACQIILFVSLSFSMAMVLSALLTIPTARQADRSFDDFRKGDLLAEWSYTPEEWETFVYGEMRRRWRAGWVIFGLCGGVSAASGLIIAWAASSTLSSRLTHCGYVLAGLAGMSVPFSFLLRWILNSKARALRANPKAMIGRRAVYCGGDFDLWGGLWTVRSATVKQDPPMLEIVVGYTRNAGRAMQVVDLLSAVTGHPTTTSSMVNCYRIPIPAGQMQQAREIAGVLMPAAARSPAVVTQPKQVAPASSQKPARLLAEPPAMIKVSGRHPARRWWFITAAAFVLGLICFILVGLLDNGRAANQPESAATMTSALLGCLLWIICLVAFVYAIIVSWRTRSRPR